MSVDFSIYEAWCPLELSGAKQSVSMTRLNEGSERGLGHLLVQQSLGRVVQAHIAPVLA